MFGHVYEGYNCSLLITDEFSQYSRGFIFASKAPPIATIVQFLKNYGLKEGNNFFRTDQSKRLEGSIEFRKCIQEADYVLETTGVDGYFENGIVERQHRAYDDNVIWCRFYIQNIGHEHYNMMFMRKTEFHKQLCQKKQLHLHSILDVDQTC